MRVIETDPTAIYKMGKNKKHKIRKTKENEADDSSEDGILNGCPHVSKAINLAAMRKALMKANVCFGECSQCSKEPSKSAGKDLFDTLVEGSAAAAEADEVDSTEATVCVCLQCGHQGCDRNSANKHALKHYKTPHSSLHSIIVNLTTWSTWCYTCDDEVPLSGKVKGCIDFLQKQAGVAKPAGAHAMSRPLESPSGDASPGMTNTLSSKNVASVSCVKVKGLSNLGNTCFFNAVMQSMCQTRGLDSILAERSKAGRSYSIPGVDGSLESDSSCSEEDAEEEAASKKNCLAGIQTSLGEAGPVTLALLNFVQEMKGGTTRNGIVNPTSLFSQVCKKAPRFKGFQQQDSHELLRYLVDCIRTEEIKRGQASILKFFKLPETIHPKKVDEETKMKVKEYGRQVKHTFFDSLFGGQLVSTVKCEECKSVSQIFEAFLDLSLPVMEEKPQRPNLILIGKKKDQIPDGVDEGGGGATASGGGPDLDAYAERTSKYQDRKNKRLAKKDSKRKAKLQKSKSVQSHDNPTKAQGEDKGGGAESEGGSDGNKSGNEKEADDATLESSGRGEDLAQSRRPMPCVKTPQSSNTSMDSVADGQKERINHSSKPAGQDETDDPSDADVEDNLESDMSRVGSSYSAQTNHVNVTHTLPSSTTTNVSAESSFSLTLTGSDQHAQGRQSSNSHTDMDVSATISLNGDVAAAPVVVNGDTCSVQSGSSITENCLETEKCETSICDGLTQLSLSNGQMNISCEVNINNFAGSSQEQQLSNDLGKLSLQENGKPGTSLNVDVDKDSGVVVMKTDEDNCSVHSVETGGSECQVSASFTLTLPEHSSNSTNHKVDSLENGDTTNKTVANVPTSKEETRDADNHVEDGAETQKLNQHQNVVKTQQEHLKEARSYSMNTLAPRYHPTPKECSIWSCLNQFTAAELLTGSNKFGCKECTKRRQKNSVPQKGDKKSKDTVYSNASKQYLIYRPPAVLTLHLKRFEQTGLMSRKVNRHVDFPLLLDLAPYCSSLCLGVKEAQSKVLYSLYAVVEHSGRLSGGHYTAYIKVRPGLTSPTQFLHTQPPSPLDLLNVYLNRILKFKEGARKEEDGSPADKEAELGAESLLPPGRWFHISDSRVNEVTEAMVLKAQAYLLFYERIF